MVVRSVDAALTTCLSLPATGMHGRHPKPPRALLGELLYGADSRGVLAFVVPAVFIQHAIGRIGRAA